MKRYGVPYMGSKNKIARQIVDRLPAGDVFVDLFCGGCAITHAAMESGKWSRFIANDIDVGIPQLFADAAAGKYNDEKRWISREDFFKLKDTDAYVRTCWSFGSKKDSYIYGKEIEPWKKALRYARVFGDTSLLREFGIKSDGSRKDIAKHYYEYQEKYKEWIIRNYNQDNFSHTKLQYAEHLSRLNNMRKNIEGFVSCQRLQNYQRICDVSDYTRHFGPLNREEQKERLQRLQSLQSLESLERLQVSGLDYRDVPITPGAVVYADPPYAGTEKYGEEVFDSAAFFEWVRTRPFPVYVSEYHAPDDFTAVFEIERKSKLSSTNNLSVVEKLFLHKRFLNPNAEFSDLPLFAVV